MKQLLFASLIIILLAACGAKSPDVPVTNVPGVPTTPVENPYAPQPGDETRVRANVYIDSMQLLILESFPLQFRLAITGNLPDPCHELRYIVSRPDDQNNINIDIYSVADPKSVCIQMLQPFDISILLGSFPAGTYTVWVNGQQVGEVNAQ